MEIIELRRQRAAKIAEADGLMAKATAEKRALSGDEEKRFDALLAEADALKVQIDALEQRLARLAASHAEMQNSQPPATGGQGLPSAGDVSVGENRAKGKPWESFGHFLQAVKRAADKTLSREEWDPRLEYRAPSGMSVMTPSDGGFLVGTDMALDLTVMGMSQTTLAQRCRRIPISGPSNGITLTTIDQSSRANGSRWGGVRAYWRAEADSVTATAPKFRQVEMKLQDLMALAYATDELLSDAAALGSVIRTAFAEEFAFVLDDAIMNGTGAGTPLGILTAPALISVAKETAQAATTLVTENVIKMWSRCHGRSRLNAVWFINQDIEPQLHTMTLNVGTGGVPVYMPANGLANGQFSTLYGRPVIPTEFNATLGTVGDIVLADLSQYLLIEKGGVQVAESIHVRFINGENTFRFMARYNGQPLWHAALTPFKGSSTTSPFVAVATRA